MPLTLSYTQGVLPENAIPQAGKRITDAFLKWHGLTGNTVMTPNVSMQILAIPKTGALAGGEPIEGVWLECKTPSFAFADRDIQEGFFKDATDIIEELTEGKVPRNRIFSNVVHTVDGTWNMDGRAMTNEQMSQAIAQG